MKEIVLKLYEFDELSKDSQERIIERERWNIMDCISRIGIVDITKPPMFVTMPTIRQQKCIADLGKQRRSQGRCFSLICWKRRY